MSWWATRLTALSKDQPRLMGAGEVKTETSGEEMAAEDAIKRLKKGVSLSSKS